MNSISISYRRDKRGYRNKARGKSLYTRKTVKRFRRYETLLDLKQIYN